MNERQADYLDFILLTTEKMGLSYGIFVIWYLGLFHFEYGLLLSLLPAVYVLFHGTWLSHKIVYQ